MFMKKKVVAIVLAVILGMGTLAGCGSTGVGSSTSGTGAADVLSTESSEDSGTRQSAESAGEIVKLSALAVKHPLTKDVNEMQWMTDLEEACGVEVEWQQVSSDWDQKKNSMFASGDIPDVLLSAAGDADFVQFNGLFEDMGPLIEKYAPNIQEMFEAYPDVKYMCTDMNGKIYTLPRIDGTYEDCKNIGSMYINKTWLDNLGLDVPTNWDELEKVLIAFKEQDANQNGDPNDEIPMDFNGVGNDYSPALLLGGLGIALSNGYSSGFFAEDGQVKCWYVDDRFRTLLIYLQKLWNQGLINEETFTADYSQFQSTARGEGKTASVGFTWGWNRTDRFGTELADQYVPVMPLKGDPNLPEEKLYYVCMDCFCGKNVISMSAACKNKEAAMKFIDGFYDYDVSLELMYGGMNEVDNCIKKNEDGSYEVLPPADPSIDPSSWQWTNTFVNNGGFWVRKDVKVTPSVPDETPAEKKLYNPYQEIIPEDCMYKQDLMKYTESDQNTMAMTETNMKNIWDQQVSQWIVGTDDIEAGWDAYVQSIENAGLQQVLDIRQNAYDTYRANTGK